MTRNEQLRIEIMTLNMFTRHTVEGVMSNEQFERYCVDFIETSGLHRGDAESLIELAIEKAQLYAV